MFKKAYLLVSGFGVPFLLQAHPWGEEHMGWGHMFNFWWGGGIMWLLLLIAVGVIIYLVVRSPRESRPASSRTPLEILKERYARGELTREEFLERKKDLE